MSDEREMVTKTGAQKAMAAAAPSWTASLLTLVYAVCGAFGIGPEQSGHEVQAALGFLVLGGVNYALTWYMPNAQTTRPETEAERVARIKHDLDNPEN